MSQSEWLFAAEEKRARRIVVVKREECIVDRPVFVDFSCINVENGFDVVEINQAPVDVVLDAVHAVEEPVRTLANVPFRVAKRF